MNLYENIFWVDVHDAVHISPCDYTGVQGFTRIYRYEWEYSDKQGHTGV